MLAGLLSIILGTSAVLTFKAAHHLAHFKTWHGVRTLLLPRVPILSTLFLGPWSDHFYLAHYPGHRWRRKRLVRWGRLRGRSESQASVEVSQAIGLRPIDFTPGHHQPRWSVTFGLVPQQLCRPAYCLHTGAHFHPRIRLRSRQVHHIFLAWDRSNKFYIRPSKMKFF
jgi:hypothetical protein